MALTTTSLASPIGSTIYIDTTADGTVEVAATSAKTVYQIYIDNEANSDPCYLKLCDATSATSGTTEPSFVVYAAGSATSTYVIPTGLAFNAGVCFWVTAAGTVTSNNVTSATTGKAKTDTTSPSLPVEVRLHTS